MPNSQIRNCGQFGQQQRDAIVPFVRQVQPVRRRTPSSPSFRLPIGERVPLEEHRRALAMVRGQLVEEIDQVVSG
jgi:hypothetical protein